MDNYEEVYKSICRVCLLQNKIEDMVSLTDKCSEDGLSCFGKAINILTNVSLRKDDNLPNFMCQKCVFLLKQSIYFKLKSESSDKKLKTLVENDVNKDVSNVNMKEIVCEYVMFDHYFPSICRKQLTSNSSVHKNIVKSKNLSHITAPNNCSRKTETNVTNDKNVYEFDDNTNHEDLLCALDDSTTESNQDTNQLLNTIQDLVNTDSSSKIIYKRQRKHKFKHKLQRNELKRRPRYRKKIEIAERNLTCKICHRILANSLTYNHHMQRHNNCRYICDQCGKGFPVLTEMHMHQIAKHGIGPYLQCDHCPYKAPRKLNLIEHMRLHTGERPFTCDKCGLTFRRRAIWRNHLVCHMEKKHQCTYCPRRFFRHTEMLAHCNNVHVRVYMYMCNVCNVTYTKTETVRRHMLVKHGIPREKQGRIIKITNTNEKFTEKVIL